MPGPLTETGKRFLYVIGHDTGPQKVGFSFSPQARARQLSRAGEAPLVVHCQAEVLVEHAHGTEALAHWFLRDRAMGGELFDVSPQQAAFAITEAAERYIQGQRAPEREEAHNQNVNLTVSLPLLDQINEWRIRQRPVLTMAKAVRVLVERALEAERKDAKRTKD